MPDETDLFYDGSEDENGGEYDGENFTPSNPDDDERPSIIEIMDQLGIADLGEITVNIRDAEDASLIRGDRFAFIEDAIYYLYDIGVLGFSSIVQMEVNVYAVSIPDDTR